MERNGTWTKKRLSRIFAGLCGIVFFAYRIHNDIIKDPDLIATYSFLFSVGGMLWAAIGFGLSRYLIIRYSISVVLTGCLAIVASLIWLGFIVERGRGFSSDIGLEPKTVSNICFYLFFSGLAIAALPYLSRGVEKSLVAAKQNKD